MPILLRLTVADGIRRAALNGADAPLAETPIADLLTIDKLIDEPYSQGAALLDALDA